MIYFFDIDLKLKKIVTPENALEAVHEHELNNMILGSVTMDMAYAKAFIDDVDHFGYYWRGNFYLHRIRRVEDSHINETVTVTGRHIFFEDMLYGLPIGDFRPQNRDAAYILKNTIDTNTRWLTVMTDVTGVLSTNFYRQVPWEVIEWVTENFRVEFEPVILFDGQKINGYQLHVANKLGVNKHKRIPFSRVTELDYEIDYSEIITSLAGYGKGEEVGEGYGRRINIADVDFSRNGIVSPLGSHYMEDPNITALYGKDNGEPKYAVDDESFTDIEDPALLAEAMYEAYLEMSRPKMVFSASVIDVGDVGIGDTQTIVRPEYDVFYSVRIHKLVVNLHDPDDADVELGDYEHFKESKAERASRRADKAWKKRYESAIQEMKRDWDADFEGMKEQIKQGYEQAVIDANANIEAAEQRMTEEIEGQRTEIMQEVETSKQEAIQQAESDAKAKADSVQSNLDSFKDVHQRLYDEVTADVLDINDFLGEKDFSLDWYLNSLREEMQDQINAVNSANPNLIVGSTLEQFTDFEDYGVGQSQIHREESMNYIRTTPVGETSKIFGYLFPSTVHLEQGQSYTLGIDFRSESVEDLDYIYFMGPYSNIALSPVSQTRGITADGTWNRYYFKFDWVDSTRDARLLIATNTNYGDADYGWFDTRRAMLYEGSLEVPWSPSPSDNSQVITQLSREISELEDGLKSKATKTEFDLLSGDFTQFTNEFTTTAERWESQLQEHDNWLDSNGSNLLQMADRVQSKVWMNDFSEVNPNLIPFADVSDPDNLSKWEMWNGNANSVDSNGEYVVRATSSSSLIGIQSQTFDVKEGEPLVLSAVTRTRDNWQTRPNFRYTYLINENGTNQYLGSAHEYQQIDASRRRNVWKFTPDFTGSARILIGTYTLNEGVDARFTFKEPKLERGTERTPFMNAFSNVEQLANSLKLQVQELDGEFLSQSDIVVRPDYVQLGSQRLGDNQLASIFRVSPNAIDAITDELNLTGNLNVKGQIESISMSAVKAEFASLFAAQVRAGTIDVDYINGLTAEFQRMYTLNANIERLVSQHVFTNNVKALSIDAIYADLRSVNSEIMDTNILKANWIQGGQALFDKVFINNAMVERLTSKTVFARDVQSITIDAVQANIQTVMNSMGQVEGGLTIRRPDGAVWVQNGQARGHTPVQVYDSYAADEVEFTGLNFVTGTSHWQSIKYFYTPHEGTRLRVTWAVGLQGPSASEVVEVRVSTFSSYSPINMGIGSSSRSVSVFQGKTEYITQDIPMPPPQYRETAAYLQFRRSPSGTNSKNRVTARLLFIGQFE